MTILVLMGVSGSGKSTVAALLAGQLEWEFAEGDDMHPPENVAKMHAGHPLTDADRAPWLATIRSWIDEHTAAGRSGIIACSALRHRYRDVLRTPEVWFVHLAGTYEVIRTRLTARTGHFMPPELLRSQFDTLEPLREDEQGFVLDVGPSPRKQAELIVERLGLSARWLRTTSRRGTPTTPG